MSNVGQELLNVPFAEMTHKLAFAIAEGQTKLDMNSTRVAEFMSKEKIKLPKISNPSETDEYPLIALGFFPGFYQFQEAIIEVKMAITMAKTQEFGLDVGAKAGFGPFSASVNASYKSKYNYSQEGSSLLRVKLAPAPPPTILEQYMNMLIEKQGEKLREDANPTPAPNP
ncbi:MAG TPA: hypothetical protein PKD10_18330 [Paracoccaceae bacterium]|nr:hypothetical protein [Paracoccaceae bacterium]HMO73116.1 hypothetical protein [Paracoccaceae bacterium]